MQSETKAKQAADGFFRAGPVISPLSTYDAFIAGFTAALSDQEREVEVKIKPLEWHEADPENYIARDGYKVWPHTGGWAWSHFLGGARWIFRSFEAAKAAAQADYEQRIRSALVDVPVEPASWQYFNDGAWRHSTNPEYHRKTGYQMRPLFAHPPHREGEDSAEVVTLTRAEADRIAQRLEFDASWDKCGDGYYSIKRQLGTIAATRSASATSAKGVSDV